MSAEDLERYESEIELQLYQEYRAVLPMFRYVVETERRFYLANDVKMEAKGEGYRTWFEIELGDAWVWDMYRPARFVSSVRVVFNVESSSVQPADRVHQCGSRRPA